MGQATYIADGVYLARAEYPYMFSLIASGDAVYVQDRDYDTFVNLVEWALGSEDRTADMRYIGDGLYVRPREHAASVFAFNGIWETRHIFIERQTWEALKPRLEALRNK